MNETQLAQMYDLKVKAVAEELKKAQGIIAMQEELKIASQAGADHLKQCLVALRTAQKNLAGAILCRNRVTHMKSHRKFHQI